ncbi:MAG: hypothetical protein LCH56_10695 [Proteobacteria bacterium]|nr:hypothetical protein [Pseudomonadota bacterium]
MRRIFHCRTAEIPWIINESGSQKRNDICNWQREMDTHMPRRREIAAIARNLALTFVSRNNDVDGYWAIGKLYSHALKAGVSELDIDLLNDSIAPPSSEFNKMLSHYKAWIGTQMPLAWLKRAGIALSFEPQPDAPINSWDVGKVFQCSVTLVDDQDHEHIARERFVCRPHDPATEIRSTRSKSVQLQLKAKSILRRLASMLGN